MMRDGVLLDTKTPYATTSNTPAADPNHVGFEAVGVEPQITPDLTKESWRAL